jgi:hypothetical protein
LLREGYCHVLIWHKEVMGGGIDFKWARSGVKECWIEINDNWRTTQLPNKIYQKNKHIGVIKDLDGIAEVGYSPGDG